MIDHDAVSHSPPAPAHDEVWLDNLLEAVLDGKATRVVDLLAPLHAADVADVFEQLRPAERRGLMRLWGPALDPELLLELPDALRAEVVKDLPPDILAGAVRELDSDDVVDLIEDLEAPQKALVLGALADDDRAAIEQSLSFPEESAGRLMQRDVVIAPEHWTVGEAIDFLRAEAWLPDQFYHVILVDPRMKPVGYASLGRILSSRRDVRLRDITEDSFRTVRATEQASDVAMMFNRYHLISVPVVDDHGRLLGVITIDDAMFVLDEEHEEDVLRLAGVGAEATISAGPLATARGRLPWLVVNLFTASLSAMVISSFESTIAALVTLAALMPIVASTGGIAGTQSLAVAVRGLATHSLTRANARRAVVRELAAGLLNGAGLALLLGIGGVVIFGDPILGAVLGGAMICNQIVAAMGGVLVPLALDRMGFDPALASGTFVTTLTDVMGFFVFLGLASVFLL